MPGGGGSLALPSWARDDGVVTVAVALLYAVVATSMSVINRFCLLVFPLPTVVLLIQMAATLAILGPLIATKRLAFAPFRWPRFKQLFGISALYTANTAFALFGLRSLNLPMYTAIKRLTPMMILVIKSLWRRRWPQPRLTASVGLVVLGCVIAGAGDLTFDGPAYLFALASCVMQSLYLLLVEFQGDDVSGASTSELLWYNALTSLPLLALLALANGDAAAARAAAAAGIDRRGAPYFYLMVGSAATLGCLLNFSLFLCTLYTSALTTTIVGVLRGIVTILLGFALDTVPFSALNVAGIAINTAGGTWYAIIKATERYGPDLSLHLKSLGRQAAAARADKDGDTVAAPRDGGGGGDMEAGGGAPREEQQPLLSRRHA